MITGDEENWRGGSDRLDTSGSPGMGPRDEPEDDEKEG
jgi:hypothetical protein